MSLGDHEGRQKDFYVTAIKRMFADMERANEQMKCDQEEIDRLNMETREILARLKLCENRS